MGHFASHSNTVLQLLGKHRAGKHGYCLSLLSVFSRSVFTGAEIVGQSDSLYYAVNVIEVSPKSFNVGAVFNRTVSVRLCGYEMTYNVLANAATASDAPLVISSPCPKTILSNFSVPSFLTLAIASSMFAVKSAGDPANTPS